MSSKKIASVTLCSLMFLQSGCGTLLYPERQGQTSGRIDPTVLILDGIGLFFFVVPGLVAFAVDFGTGTIYLPNSGNSTKVSETLKIQGNIDAKDINSVIEEEFNIIDVLSHEKLLVEKII